MKVTIEELETFLLDHYSNGGIDQSLFMKLVEEIGEVAEVLNKKAGTSGAAYESWPCMARMELRGGAKDGTCLYDGVWRSLLPADGVCTFQKDRKANRCGEGECP